MIIKISFIEKIIKEEIQKAVRDMGMSKQIPDEESKKRQIIQIFIKGTQDQNLLNLFNSLKQITNPLKAINFLKIGEVDTSFYIRAGELHNAMVRKTGKGEEVNLDVSEIPPAIDGSVRPSKNMARLEESKMKIKVKKNNKKEVAKQLPTDINDPTPNEFEYDEGSFDHIVFPDPQPEDLEEELDNDSTK